MTGEILDADIILTDGWIRHFWRKFNQELPKLAMEGYSPETLSWLQQNPNGTLGFVWPTLPTVRSWRKQSPLDTTRMVAIL